MFCYCFRHQWRYGISYLFILACLTALENEIIRERLYSCTFSYCGHSIPFVMKMVSMTCIYRYAWALTIQTSPCNMNFSCSLQFFW